MRAWMMRKTIHLVPTEDAGWLVPLFSEAIVRWSRKRLGDFGLDRNGQDRALAMLHRAVDEEGAVTRPELAERLQQAGFETGNEFKVHLWLLATLDGELCLGPDRGKPHVSRADERLGRRTGEALAGGLARRARPPLPPRLCARRPSRPRSVGRPAAAGHEARLRAHFRQSCREVEVGGERLAVLGRSAAARRGPDRPTARRLRQLQPRLRQPRLPSAPRARESRSRRAAGSSARRSRLTAASSAPGRRSKSGKRLERRAGAVRRVQCRDRRGARVGGGGRGAVRGADCPLRSRARRRGPTDPRRRDARDERPRTISFQPTRPSARHRARTPTGATSRSSRSAPSTSTGPRRR